MSLFNYIVWIVSLGYYNNTPSNTTQPDMVINNNKKFKLFKTYELLKHINNFQ